MVDELPNISSSSNVSKFFFFSLGLPFLFTTSSVQLDAGYTKTPDDSTTSTPSPRMPTNVRPG